MNINAQELTIMRKNMKFGEAQPTATTTAPVAEPPVTKPEAGLNALDAQAQNNIAFQGVKIPTAVRKGVGKMMLMAALLGGTAVMTTSCDKDEPYVVQPNNTTIINTVNVDVSAWAAIFQQMLDQQKITNDQLLQLNKKMTDLYALIASGQMKAEDFYKEMYNHITTVITNQQSIEATLAQQGKTQEEIKTIMNEIKALVAEGKYKEALEKIYDILLNMDNTLTGILAEIKGLRDDIANNHKEYMAIRKEDLDMLSKLYENGLLQTQYLEGLKADSEKRNEYLANLEQNTKDLINIITDKEKYAQFLADLKALMPSDIDYTKFEAMFAAYGLKIEDVVNMSSEKLVALLKDWMINDLGNETKQNELLDSINSKLAILENLPNWNLDGIQASIDALRAAMQADNKDIMALIKDVIMKMDEVIAKLDTLVDNTGDIVKNMNNQQAYWEAALKLFGENNELLKEIKEDQKVTNKTLEGFKTNFDNIEKNQKTQISYLNILTNDLAGLRKTVEELELTVNVEGGMTREEFDSVLAERDPKMLEAFETLIKKYGFDKVPGDVQTIKDLLGDLNDLVANQTDYSAQLDRIIALKGEILDFLKNLDFSDPAALAKLDKIITLLENWKCNCECGNSSDKNDESIKDMEDMFS